MKAEPTVLSAAIHQAFGEALAGSAPSSPSFASPFAAAALPRAAEKGMHGDQASIERLGRGFARRDPVAGLDPLPWGRDAVTYSTAAVSTKHEAGQHWPELNAFRASDRFPSGDRTAASPRLEGVPASVQYLPTWLASRVSDLPDAAAWPNAPRTARGGPFTPDPGIEGLLEMVVEPRNASPAALPVRKLGKGVRGDFPALAQKVGGHPLIWLDNGATTQKPSSVIGAEARFYERDNSNVHRGAHTLAARATDAYELARAKVQRYLGASAPGEIVFVRGATEAINLVAQSWGRENVHAGDEILVTHLEHHANIVPWLRLARERGARLIPIPVDDRGDVRMDVYEAMLSPRVKLVAATQVSNALGTVVPVGPMAALARAHGAKVLVDGAQSAAHLPIDVSCLGADFFVFSGHKVYGPTGIGVLWARRDLLEVMPPWQSGGSMIRDVTFERVLYADPPAKFEAGTPNLAGAVGLGAALDYIEALGRPQIAAYEHALLDQLVRGLAHIEGLRILGRPMMRAGAVSFVMARHEPVEIARYLDRHGVAVRAGHHCAQPILRRFGVEQSVRPSVGIYNEPEDIERLLALLRALR